MYSENGSGESPKETTLMFEYLQLSKCNSQKIILYLLYLQLLKLYEHLCTPLAECVIALVHDYGCRGFLREVVREISESDSIYDLNGAKTFSIFLIEIGKNASDLVLPIMSLLLPHLDNDVSIGCIKLLSMYNPLVEISCHILN